MSPASLSSLLDIPFSSNMTAVYLTDLTGSLLWGLVSSLPQGGQPSALPSPPLLSKLLHGGPFPAQSSPGDHRPAFGKKTWQDGSGHCHVGLKK